MIACPSDCKNVLCDTPKLLVSRDMLDTGIVVGMDFSEAHCYQGSELVDLSGQFALYVDEMREEKYRFHLGWRQRDAFALLSVLG